MKKISLLFIFAACFLGFNCVSTEQTQETASKHESMSPKWLTDQGRLELFPNELYVSQLAYGNTAQECKEKAAAKISEYIKASVSYSASSTRFYKESSDNLSKEKSLQEDIQISTTNNLYKLDFRVLNQRFI